MNLTFENQSRPASLPITQEMNNKLSPTISRINSIVTDDESGAESRVSSRRPSKIINHHSIQLTNQWIPEEKEKIRRTSTASTVKSSFSAGYRY